jgi:hypothetical protein
MPASSLSTKGTLCPSVAMKKNAGMAGKRASAWLAVGGAVVLGLFGCFA